MVLLQTLDPLPIKISHSLMLRCSVKLSTVNSPRAVLKAEGKVGGRYLCVLQAALKLSFCLI